MSDIKQIRLNDTDYAIKDARIYTGEVERDSQVRFKTDGTAVLFAGGSSRGNMTLDCIAYTYKGCSAFNDASSSNYGQDGDEYYYVNISTGINYLTLINAYDIYITDYEE